MARRRIGPGALGLVAVLALGLALVPGPRRAGAAPARHPMGNFTINHYAALQVRGNGVTLRYVIDMAEIPTYQELVEIRPDRSTNITAAERDHYLQQKVPALLSGLTLSLDGHALVLGARSTQLSFPPGAGGLPTLRLDLDLFAPVAGATAGRLGYADHNFPDRIGWKEIIASAGPGGQIFDSPVPATDRSKALTAYPPTEVLSQAPTEVETAFRVQTSGVAPAEAPRVSQPLTGPVGDFITGRMDALTELMTKRNLPLEGWLFALLIAFVLGAAHALSPGHGKTVAAAYLVGSRGTPWHAVILGLSVTITHTMGVFALGFVTMYAAQYIVPDQLYPWISFLSGVTVLILGVGLFRGRWRGLQARGISPVPRLSRPPAAPVFAAAGPGAILPVAAGVRSWRTTRTVAARAGLDAHADVVPHPLDPGDGQAHSHDHGNGQAHSHDHGDGQVHSHGPLSRPHSHLPAGGGEITTRSLIALGASGGLLPCPSALIVMLSAISFGQVSFGMVLIVAFSLGLAVVLTTIGLLLLYARRFVERAPVNNGIFQRLPLVSALGVAALGLIIAVQAVTTTGLIR